MLSYIGRRVLRLIPLLFLSSVLAFAIVQLPPGDYLTEHINRLRASGFQIQEDEIARLEKVYALDRPIHEQYVKWITNILFRGDFGLSFQWNKPVGEVIGERIGLTFLIAFVTFILVWGISIPVGIYVAVHQYSFADYLFTLLGFIGLAVPSFLLALVVMYTAYSQFGVKVGGLFSPDFELAPWSLAKLADMLQRVWVPVLIIGVAGTAQLIRIMRATMLDELGKQYVMVARAKGLSEFWVVVKYPARLAINPLVSTIGWVLPWLISGGTLVDIVLNLPTAGPVLWRSLMAQDMFLAGSYILIISFLTLMGSLLSDILLALVDPRVRLGQKRAI